MKYHEELCQQDNQKFTITATGASSSCGQPGALKYPLNIGITEIHPQTKTDGEQYRRRFDDPAKKNSASESWKKENSTTKPTDSRDIPFKSRCGASDCVWASFSLSKDHEESRRVAMNKNFPRRQILIQSVQRKVQTLIKKRCIQYAGNAGL